MPLLRPLMPPTATMCSPSPYNLENGKARLHSSCCTALPGRAGGGGRQLMPPHCRQFSGRLACWWAWAGAFQEEHLFACHAQPCGHFL